MQVHQTGISHHNMCLCLCLYLNLCVCVCICVCVCDGAHASDHCTNGQLLSDDITEKMAQI
eukprot:m.309296 g.309296  ORF g.309296 m.309296 type:complete len:61 (-) comp15945_c5_seq1:71-253(-)